MIKTDTPATTAPPKPSMIADMRSWIDAETRPVIQEVTDPLTGTKALAAIYPKAAPVPVSASLFDDYRSAPVRIKGVAKMLSSASLCDHISRFKSAASILFADDDRTAPRLTCIYDYHDAEAPAFAGHRAEFAFPLSDEWKAWTLQDGKPMTMAEFAAFLEDRITDVTVLIPGEDELAEDLQKFIAATGGLNGIASPEKLIELSRGLHVHENSAVSEAVTLATGEGKLTFQSEHMDGGGKPLKVPGLFLIAIPIFRKGVPYRIAARLRYRKTPTGIVFFYELWRPDRSFDHAFRETCEHLAAAARLPLLYGRAEA